MKGSNARDCLSKGGRVVLEADVSVVGDWLV